MEFEDGKGKRVCYPQMLTISHSPVGVYLHKQVTKSKADCKRCYHYPPKYNEVA